MPTTPTLPDANFLPSIGDFDAILASYAAEAGMAARDGVVRLVTYTPHTYLLRGNSPIRNGSFDAAALLASLKAVAPLPSRFYMIDVSLTSDLLPHEFADKKVEAEYWRQHSQAGRLISHPVFGAVTSPDDFPDVPRRKISALPGVDRLPELLAALHQEMSECTPTVIYVHCEAGKDRTGEVIAAYSMQYLRLSYRDALAQGPPAPRRPPPPRPAHRQPRGGELNSRQHAGEHKR
ncbi:hypothetical protein, partial [Bordetella avium]|uniref:hypothetical protein n=1 Tax=Bordetella avium TaxID=521 RepID=UPI00307DB116